MYFECIQYILKVFYIFGMYSIECFLSQLNDFKIYCSNTNKFCTTRYIRHLGEIIYLLVDGSLKDSVLARRVHKGRFFFLKWDLRGHFWGYKLEK